MPIRSVRHRVAFSVDRFAERFFVALWSPSQGSFQLSAIGLKAGHLQLEVLDAIGRVYLEEWDQTSPRSGIECVLPAVANVHVRSG